MSNLVNTSAGVYIGVEDNSENISNKKKASTGAIVILANQGPVDQLVKITGGQTEFLKVFGTPDPALGFGQHAALTALQRMPDIYVTRVHNDARFGGLKVYQPTTGGNLAMKQFDAPKCVAPDNPNSIYLDTASAFFSSTKDLFYVFGIHPCTNSEKYRVAIEGVRDETDPAYPNTFQIVVWSIENSRIPVEKFTVSRDHQVDGYGRQQYLEAAINGKSKYIRVLDNPANKTKIRSTLMPSTGLLQYLESIGTAAIPANPTAVPPVVGVPASANYNGVAPNTLAYMIKGHNGNTDAYGSTNAIPANKLTAMITGDKDTFPTAIVVPGADYKLSGWQLFADREEVKFDLLINAGFTVPSIQEKMIAICAQRGDCFAILDIPNEDQGDRYDTTSKAVSYRNDPRDVGVVGGGRAPCFNSADAAMYTPWLEIFDKFNGRNLIVPPSGHIAALYCATDIDYATWFAPAGLKRGLLETIDPNFAQATVIYKQGDRDLLETNQVNCTRVIQGIGTAVWGATTLQLKDSALSNVNVVRLLKFCARRIDEQLMYSVFDPNDPFLRSEITYRLIDILEPIKLNRGLYNYTVLCAGPEEDNSNNTYEDVANGLLNVDVYLEPVIPAKRIFVKLIVNRAGAVIGPVTTV